MSNEVEEQDDGNLPTPKSECSNCGYEDVMLSDLHCVRCGAPNEDFSLARLNRILSIRYTALEEAMAHCEIYDKGHNNFKEHSDGVFESSPEDGRLCYCDYCGQKVLDDEGNLV
jgi:hypothetical protein